MSTIGSGAPVQDVGIPLESLLREAGISAAGIAGPWIDRVSHDSRTAGPGALFVAITGAHADGHDHAAEAVGRGAVAVVAQRPLPALAAAGIPVVMVSDSRRCLSALAAAVSGRPSERLTVAGITGTDGKTTTATMLWAAWRGAGLAAGSVTTTDLRSLDEVRPNRSRLTTMEAAEVQDQLRGLLAAGCSHVALETSSHALQMQRVADVAFRAAIYTRVTSEHLELHGSRQRYLDAKRRLLEAVSERPDGIAILDADDEFAHPSLAAVPVAQRLSYSATGQSGADLVADAIASEPAGVHFTALTPWGSAPVRLQLSGQFNVANALAALAAACATGAGLEPAAEGLGKLARVPGRMERIELGQPFVVVVDYAHTAAALTTVLTELRQRTTGRLWAVFGSAGERDLDKRPEMGRAAARLCDRVVLTDEDPREESSQTILEDIAAGAGSLRRGESLFLVPDRAEAIGFAITEAKPGDTVLLAGKGHETSLLGPAGARPWDERAVAEAAIRRWQRR